MRRNRNRERETNRGRWTCKAKHGAGASKFESRIQPRREGSGELSGNSASAPARTKLTPRA
eukprot:6109148-Pleurochrysis_carterae.AAC.3